MGGTWDLFKYPGIRSDSDMTTFGYGFNPWTDTDTVAHGSKILSYIHSTAKKFNIDKYIRYNEKVVRASWSSVDAKYTVDIADTREADGTTDSHIKSDGDADSCNVNTAIKQYSACFLFVCAGYYDYETPHLPTEFESMGLHSTFKGEIIHPQMWDPEYNYQNKRIVLIGSGATATTLAPSLVKPVEGDTTADTVPGASGFKCFAKQVTILQRSPAYVISLPSSDPINTAIRRSKFIPTFVANFIIFWRIYWDGWTAFFGVKRAPEKAKQGLIEYTDYLLNHDAEEMGRATVDVSKHFTPKYLPWEQRMTVTIDNQYFNAIKSGQVVLKTDTISKFIENGIELSSGEVLEADVIVTATGLKLKLMGGIDFIVDGKPYIASDHWLYRDSMLTNLPNSMMCIPTGYYYASSTVKAELTCRHFCRIINHMDRWGLKQCHASTSSAEEMEMKTTPVLIFDSSFGRRSQHLVPKGGDHGPWLRLEYFLWDFFNMLFGRVRTKSMIFK